jgi:hypothetical protein
MIPWTYEGTVVTEAPEGAKAFVYYMEFQDGTKYIGKKGLTSTRRKKVVGKTRRQVNVSESNWKVYLSSSSEVKAKLKTGDTLVRREILRWCYSAGEATYWELYEQMVNHVLLSGDWLNRWISIRLYGSTLKSMSI